MWYLYLGDTPFSHLETVCRTTCTRSASSSWRRGLAFRKRRIFSLSMLSSFPFRWLHDTPPAAPSASNGERRSGGGQKMSPFGEGGQGGRRRPPRRARDKRWGTGVRRGAPGVWLPPAKFRNGIWGVRHRHRPTTPRGGTRDGTPGRRALRGWLRRAAAIALGQRRTAERLRQRGWNRSRGHPKRGQQRRTIPQSACG